MIRQLQHKATFVVRPGMLKRMRKSSRPVCRSPEAGGMRHHKLARVLQCNMCAKWNNKPFEVM